MKTDIFGPAPLKKPESYPGKRPGSSYVFYGDYIMPLPGNPLAGLKKAGIPISRKHCILAYGSNANPAQLREKFGRAERGMPVLRGAMSDVDVVYANHMASYGCVPATITESEGTTCEVWAQFLETDELEIIAKSESGYFLARIPGAIRLDGEARIRPAYAYVCSAGVLLHGGERTRISAVPAVQKRYTQSTQTEVLKAVNSGEYGLSRSPYFGIDYELTACPPRRVEITGGMK